MGWQDELLDSLAVLGSHVYIRVKVEDMLLQQVQIFEFSRAQPAWMFTLDYSIVLFILFLVDFPIVVVQLPLMGELLQADGAMELFRGRVLVSFAKMGLD
jgi:hypothetical protein